MTILKKLDGLHMYDFAEKLFPINRSITGDGVRKTLELIKMELPNLKIKKIESGKKVFDWVVPEEWNVEEAHIVCPDGKKIVDFKKNNLHLVGYSEPVNKEIELDELQSHLYSLPKQPEAIPYVTSYYKKNWGFCLKDNQRKKLKKGIYKVCIKSYFTKGYLNYGEILWKGKKKKEIFFSTYICHPSMANNEVSGPVLATAIGKYINNIKNNNYSYRMIFIPETIGSIAYLSKNIIKMKKNVKAGFNLTCVGDNSKYSYIPSRNGHTLADNILQHVLNFSKIKFKKYTFLDRGSDERQYCSPGVDLPVVVFCRSKFGDYDEYHTSLDNLNFISSNGFQGSFNVIKRVVDSLEINKNVKSKFLCEPQLGKRGLYPEISKKNVYDEIFLQSNIIAYADGRSLLEIAEILNVPIWELHKISSKLEEKKIISLKIS